MDPSPGASHLGIRELRAELATHVRRAGAGDRIIVTNDNSQRFLSLIRPQIQCCIVWLLKNYLELLSELFVLQIIHYWNLHTSCEFAWGYFDEILVQSKVFTFDGGS